MPTVEDEEYSPTIITLTDENGESFMFEVVDEIEHNEEVYLAVVEYFEDPQKALEAEPTLIIFRVGEDEVDGLETFDIVDDDEEYFVVAGIFEERLSKFYDIEE
ncbi:MAG: DUF1292 domain-containing protein [Oscillospiraceae bacterium]|nr:DUF1292 domain-containing protein [Oscillospiraceae bacterium]